MNAFPAHVPVRTMEHPMKNLRYVVMHTLVAAAFIFIVQRFLLQSTLDTALLWAFVFAIMAAGLSYSQLRR